MIGEPWNDTVCLRELHRQAREAARSDEIRGFASEIGSLDNLIAYLQNLPHRSDYGLDGPRILCGDNTQRLRIMPEDPNCFERTLWYLAVAEVLDPRGLRSSATIQTDMGLHTFPVEHLIEQ